MDSLPNIELGKKKIYISVKDCTMQSPKRKIFKLGIKNNN
jgi:hypothetical protein